MFSIRTLKELFGQDIAISQEMITAIEKWGSMYRGQAPWVDEQVDSLQIEPVSYTHLTLSTNREV